MDERVRELIDALCGVLPLARARVDWMREYEDDSMSKQGWIRPAQEAVERAESVLRGWTQ